MYFPSLLNGKILKTVSIANFDQMHDTTILLSKYLEFDQKGNWIKRIDYKEGQEESIYVYERIIKYANQK